VWIYVTEALRAVGPGTEAFCNVLNTEGDRRGDYRLVYSLQAIGRRSYANEHQSQRSV